MNINITGTLEVQVTQQCNLNCNHCLMGKSRNNKITREVAEKIFENIKYVNDISFTGGEVSLAYDEIKMIIDIIKEKNIEVNQYSIIVNGTIYNERLLKLLKYTFKKGSIRVSVDYFHDKSIKEKYGNNLKRILLNYKRYLNHPHFEGIALLPKYILDSGNAKKLKDVIKVDEFAIGFASYQYNDNKELDVGPFVLFDVFGNLVSGGESYEINDNNHYGNIFNDDLSEMILNNSIYKCQNKKEFIKCYDRIILDYYYKDKIDGEWNQGYIKNNYVIRNKRIVKKNMKITNYIRNMKYYNDEKRLIFKVR